MGVIGKHDTKIPFVGEVEVVMRIQKSIPPHLTLVATKTVIPKREMKNEKYTILEPATVASRQPDQVHRYLKYYYGRSRSNAGGGRVCKV